MRATVEFWLSKQRMSGDTCQLIRQAHVWLNEGRKPLRSEMYKNI